MDEPDPFTWIQYRVRWDTWDQAGEELAPTLARAQAFLASYLNRPGIADAWIERRIVTDWSDGRKLTSRWYLSASDIVRELVNQLRISLKVT